MLCGYGGVEHAQDFTSPTRELRSSQANLLSVKHFKHKTLGEQSFAFSAPQLWNSLAIEIRMANA